MSLFTLAEAEVILECVVALARREFGNLLALRSFSRLARLD